MIFNTMAFAFLIFATNTIAHAGDWQTAFESVEVAHSKAGFIELRDKHFGLLGHLNPDKVSSAKVKSVTFEFKGQSTCMEDDHRLLFRTVSYKYCETSNAHKPEFCLEVGFLLPEAKDPCFEH